MNINLDVKKYIKNNPKLFVFKELLKKHNEFSNSCKGELNAFYGKKHTQESIDKQIKAQTGKPIHSEEHKKKLSKRFKTNNPGGAGKDNGFYGKKHTAETRRKISESLKGNTNKRKIQTRG